jgi:SAM-dependent methyltransferase
MNRKMFDEKCNKLKELYSINSKHSNYQLLPDRLKALIGDDVVTVSRYEKARLEYILSKVNIAGKSILDIGGNCGYFTFELIDRGAGKVHYYEGNSVHSEFVKQASELFEIEGKIEITNDYFNFDKECRTRYDIVLCMNVLHHIGDDYGDKQISIDTAKDNIATQLVSLAYISDILVFQLGFNWKGDRELCLFNNGTKQELIEYVRDAVRNNFKILYIGIAEKYGSLITYKDLNDKNTCRIDELGEFLNRPLFILKSIKG